MSEKSRIFVGRLQKNCGMKENEYPNIDEECGLDMAAEPAVAVGYRPIEVVDNTDYELHGHDFGMPHTIIELKAELEEADREMDDPDKWCTSEQMWAEIRQAFPWANIR